MKTRFADTFERLRELMVALAALFIFALLLSLLQYWRLRDRQLEDLRTQASMVAQNVSAAVVFDSPEDASESLSALQQNPAILTARLLRHDASLFTVYSSAPAGAAWLHDLAGTAKVEVHVKAGGRGGVTSYGDDARTCALVSHSCVAVMPDRDTARTRRSTP